jgi:hypothetical protein
MRFCPFLIPVYLAEVNLADMDEALRTELELTGVRDLQVSGQPQARPPGGPAQPCTSNLQEYYASHGCLKGTVA